jgi:hypothetical protein
VQISAFAGVILHIHSMEFKINQWGFGEPKAVLYDQSVFIVSKKG